MTVRVGERLLSGSLMVVAVEKHRFWQTRWKGAVCANARTDCAREVKEDHAILFGRAALSSIALLRSRGRLRR